MTHWDFSPLVVLPLAASGLLYGVGVARLWCRAGVGRGIPMWSVACFAAGWLTTASALVSPLAWVSAFLFSAHMTQHTLLMLVAAPLLTFGHTLLGCLWALPAKRRDACARAFRSRRALGLWTALTAPLVVFLVQGAALWVWHVPALYEAALHSDVLHAMQHVCLLGVSGLFWWAMVYGRYGKRAYGLGVLYVFLTTVHTSVLGALLTVSPSPWYGEYVSRSAAWNVDALADQQLAGLLMWIPAGAILIVLALAMFAAWLGEAERRVRFGASDAAARAARSALLFAALLSCLNCSDRRREAETLTAGEVERGRSAISRSGCGSCHEIPGIPGATATVASSLSSVARRQYLAGHLRNTPVNMIQWIQRPQTVDPGNAMPDLGLSDADARDIAAYLYTLH